MFHYSLKTLMLVVLGVSVFCAVFFAFPLFLTAIFFALVLFLSPAAVAAGCLYLRGGAQAFCLGCAMPIVLVMLGMVLGNERILGEVLEGLVLEPMFDWFNHRDAPFVKLFYLGYLMVVGLSGLTSWGIFVVGRRQARLATENSASSAAVSPSFPPTEEMGEPFALGRDGHAPPDAERPKNPLPAPPGKPNNL